MKKERKLTCIVCPKGCELLVELDDNGAVSNISGHTCKRGEGYAFSECTAPVRTVTSTVRCKDGSVVPVKTSCPIPKDKVFDVMRMINTYVAENTLSVGDVLIKGVLGTDADVIATANKR